MREAVRRLEDELLLVRSDTKRLFVADWSRDDIEEMFVLRQMLECHAAERAAIDREIQALLKTHSSPALRSSKGMGPIFQATSLALLPELGTLVAPQYLNPVRQPAAPAAPAAARPAPTNAPPP